VAEDKEAPRDAEKESSGRRRSRRDREQELAKKMSASNTLSDRFESRGEFRAVDSKCVVFVLCMYEWWGAGMVFCLKRVVDLHMAQLMPLPLTVSCFSKIQIG